ncbi:thioredoxin domain-containing protein [Actinospica durhamensis]|uniref:Thioredoxin domain-containing protein n=1 Tax=Actinospica durhamensis TaxID=1508375 RepID=A0A941IND1_9ACTN|nr:thioredoxin domain-containing protein [Actinospica durhamensis]MBR7835275.1 thioredoxin domain-containing protein [Actinospica durhamensis]
MNRLASATSPYLLQHADNPVDWHEWGEEAFAEARRRDVPLLISIGYSSCHWCHVMAHESFEDPTTASAMNAGFVCVKVDREERPDVDAVYMTATQAMTGHGGWPMTVFADTAGRPFYCGTYFPPRAQGSVPGFLTVLAEVARAWTARRGEVTSVGETVAARMGELAVPVTGDAPDASLLAVAVARLEEEFDPDLAHGGRAAGFGTAPKFPPSMTLLQLLRHYRRTGSTGALDMVTRTCAAMARGGIYDQLGGGFSRYSVDINWGIPHFEKMLYDNALLLRAYALLWRVSPEPLFRRIAEETAAFLIRELGTASGGFASALDADTDGVEGLTYVWTYEQLVEVLGAEDADVAARVYGVSRKGNFEHGASVLRLAIGDEAQEKVDGEETAEEGEADVERVAPRLRVARAQRSQPYRDDKVVASWNGLAISALVEASVALDRPDLLAAAVRCGSLLAEVHLADGRLVRTSRDGRASTNPGVLEDYGCVAEGFTLLYSATGDHAWLSHAETLLTTVREQFQSADGLHDTAADAPPLYFRPSDPTDNASPSGASAAAAGFAAYALAAASPTHLQDAHLALAPAGALAEQAPRFAGYGLAVAEALLSESPAMSMCPGPFSPGD